MGKKVAKLFLILIFGIFLIGFVNAACPPGDGYLGNKDIGECVRITQTCASCSFVNISSIVLTNSNVTLAQNVSMESAGNGEWVYNFCDTSTFGNYFIQGMGDLNSIGTSFKSCFDIGQNMSIPESIIYTLFVFVMFFIFLTMVYFIIILPGENQKDENDVVIGVVRLKYIKILLIGVAYAVLIIILNLMNGLAVNFASLGIFAGILGFLFEVMIRVAWPFTFIIIIWILYLLVKDSNVQKNIDKLGGIRV